MPAPTWDQYMIPSLRVLADGDVRRGRDVVAAAADHLRLSEADRAVVIPSGQEQWVNRGNWALSYLARAGAVERPSRGRYQITDVGRGLLTTYPDGLTEKDLRSVPGYESPRSAPKPAASGAAPISIAPAADEGTALDPDEQIEDGISRIHADVADQLLTRIQAQEPEFFEKAVLDLLMAMGYGGAEGSATRTQLSRDDGIDGIIDQDALGGVIASKQDLPVGGGLIGGVCGWRGWGCRSVTGRRSRRPRKRAGRCGGSPVTWGVARR